MVYKITEINCYLWLFANYIQTQNKYLGSLEKTTILTWVVFGFSCQFFSCKLNSLGNYSLENICYWACKSIVCKI